MFLMFLRDLNIYVDIDLSFENRNMGAKELLKTTTVQLGQETVFKVTVPLKRQPTPVWFCHKDGFWSPGVKPADAKCPTCGGPLLETVA